MFMLYSYTELHNLDDYEKICFNMARWYRVQTLLLYK